MSPALNGSSAVQRFKGSDVIEIRDGVTFDFYTGLPQIEINQIFINHMPVKMGGNTHWVICIQVSNIPAHL